MRGRCGAAGLERRAGAAGAAGGARLSRTGRLDRESVSIETFHGWFWRLLRRAPLGSGVAQSADLLEAPRRLVDEAWNEFAGELLEADAQALSDYEELVTRIGDFSTTGCCALPGQARRVVELRRRRSGAGHRSCCEPMREVLRAGGFSASRHPGEILRHRASSRRCGRC